MPTAVADDGTVPHAGSTVMLDGSGSASEPWGTNVTYSWAPDHSVDRGDGQVDNATSVTPTSRIPQVKG